MDKAVGVVRAVFRLCAFVLNCVWVIPLQTLVLLITRGPLSYVLPRWWHRIMCLIFGLKVEVVGRPAVGRQVLYMSNHLSYMDIPVIGSVIRASFVAKSDVSSWPVFGYLSTLQQTAFVLRKKSQAKRQSDTLQERIRTGESLIIFPEGTSTSGTSVLPFKSSLFALAFGEDNPDMYVQPVTIDLLHVDGQAPETKEIRDIYAWPRDMDMELHHHLWRFARTAGAHIRLTFHEPLKARDHQDRKVLAKTCWNTVSKGLVQ